MVVGAGNYLHMSTAPSWYPLSGTARLGPRRQGKSLSTRHLYLLALTISRQLASMAFDDSTSASWGSIESHIPPISPPRGDAAGGRTGVEALGEAAGGAGETGGAEAEAGAGVAAGGTATAGGPAREARGSSPARQNAAQADRVSL